MSIEALSHIASLIYVIGFIPMAFLWAKENKEEGGVNRNFYETGFSICTYLFTWPITVPFGLIYLLFIRYLK